MRSLVSLWFPDFPVERFIRAQIKAGRKPPPRGLPFALVERGRAGLRLAAVNAAARQFGLTRGMRLADARAQLPELLTEAHEPDADMASLLGLCRWMERYSPWVSPDAPDGLLLDITGIGHLFGGEARIMVSACVPGRALRLALRGRWHAMTREISRACPSRRCALTPPRQRRCVALVSRRWAPCLPFPVRHWRAASVAKVLARMC
jgi:protein ImuB